MKVDKPGDDTDKVSAYDKLAYLYSNTNPDSGIIFAKHALDLSVRLNWEKGIAVANYDLGINYQAKADYYMAHQYNLKALTIYEKLGNKRSIAAILSSIASVYQLQGNYTKALEYHLKALTSMEELGDMRSQAIILDHIGTLYKEQKDYARTTEYYNAAIDIKKELNDAEGLALSYGNFGIIYDAQGQYKKALENHSAALEANKRIRNDHGIQVNLANIGIAYLHLGNPEKALIYHTRALRLSERLGSRQNVAISLGNVGETYLAIAKRRGGKQDKLHLGNAINNLEQAVELCRAVNFLAPTTEFIPYLTEAYAMSGDFQKAYEYQKIYSAIKDSIFSVESALQIANLETGRKMALKEKDLKLKEQQIKIIELQLAKKHSTQILYIIGIVFLILVLGITIKSVISYRKSNKLLTREKKLYADTILSQYAKINDRNRVLEEIANKYSHDIRGHVATILGLAHLFNKQNYADPQNENIVDGISESAESLDEVIREIVKQKVD